MHLGKPILNYQSKRRTVWPFKDMWSLALCCAIPVLIVGVLALSLYIQLSKSAPAEVRRPTGIKEMALLPDALRAFEIDNGRFPTTAEGLNALVTNPGLTTWTHQYIDVVPLDKWGHAFIYKGSADAPDGDFDIISAGADGILGTADDIDKNSH